MSRRKRILVAGIFHETHSFVETRTTLRDFAARRGGQLLEASGDVSPLGAALEAAEGFQWEIVPAVEFRAQPSGLVDDEVVEAFWHEFRTEVESVRSSTLDGVFLVLHGAMVAQSFPDVEGTLLARIRTLHGMATLPIFGVIDLHANFTQRMALHANCLVAYRENPHVDARDSAIRAVCLLDRALMTGRLPRTLWQHPPLIWPPTGTDTALVPMRSLEALARELELRHPNFLCVNVIAGFSFADIREAGVSFTVVTEGGAEEAQAALRELSESAWRLREFGNATKESAEAVVAQAMQDPVPGLTVVAEPSDNIGGGAPGDGTGLLDTFIKLSVKNAAVAIADASAVAALASLALGEKINLNLGGRGSRLGHGPLCLDVELVSRSTGRFKIIDKKSHLASIVGDFFDMGPCAVVRHGAITILLTSRPTPPMDIGQWASQGIDVKNFSYLGVKAAVAHRHVYEPIAARMLSAETAGPCSSRLASLPYEKLQRPIFPLDELARASWPEPANTLMFSPGSESSIQRLS
jgi:microcystin degradation protein MlrC